MSKQLKHNLILVIGASSWIVLTLCIIVATLAPIQSAYSQTEAADTFTPNLKNIDIHSLIETVSLHSGKNFIVDPRVKATVTVVSSEPVTGEKLYELFLSVLDVHGFAAVPAGSFIKIVPATIGKQNAVPVFNAQPEQHDELVTEVIPVQHVPAQQIVDALAGLVSATGALSAEPTSNTLVLTDSAANIARLKSVIRTLDSLN